MGTKKMKIAILFLTLIGLSFASATESTTGMCLDFEVNVYSSNSPAKVSFNIDMRKLKKAQIKDNREQFQNNNHDLVPLEQVGLVLEKKVKNLPEEHHKFLRNTEENVWMPYAYAGRWHRSGYVISNQMMRTSVNKDETPMVHYEFVFDPDLNNISNQDMDAILIALQENTKKRIEIKTMIKDTVFRYQDTYLAAHEALQILIQKTREAKDQLIVEEKKLTAVKNDIMKSNGQIAVLIKLKETLTINVQDITSKLVEKNDNLKILQEILRSQQEDLKNFKKTDVSIDLAYRKQQVAIMSYSKVPPEEFKKEHEIAVTKKMENVNTNYAKCNNQVENAIACNTATRAAMSLAKKLRKGFF